MSFEVGVHVENLLPLPTLAQSTTSTRHIPQLAPASHVVAAHVGIVGGGGGVGGAGGTGGAGGSQGGGGGGGGAAGGARKEHCVPSICSYQSLPNMLKK